MPEKLTDTQRADTPPHPSPALQPDRIVTIRMPDGVSLAAAVYLPKSGAGISAWPTLLAASPYRFDNNIAPAVPVFLWRETGPIDWYLEQGYAFVHLDVRGTGRSEGEYRYMDAAEQHDLYEVIEWIARQPWSTGKVGGIGQSYYARMQWFMAIERPPHLACIAPYDGNVDTYRSSAYTGGIPGDFPGMTWYNGTVRTVNQHPAQGPSRMLPWDYAQAVREHPTYDDFWKERCAAERLDRIEVPLLSIGVWRKVDLHLNGNIVGFQGAKGPKKLLVFGSATVQDAVQDFSSVAFHARHLLPFYDRYLKGADTGYDALPDVRYFPTGGADMRTASTWPPLDTAPLTLHLSGDPSGSVTSLNDGSLVDARAEMQAASTSYRYPDPGWRMGAVGMDTAGRPDPARRVLTFTTAPLTQAIDIAGPVELVLYASSTNTDTDFIVKLSEQYEQDEEARQRGDNPRYLVVSKGWLRASHREVDPARSLPNAPYYRHESPRPLVPGEVVEFRIAIMPTAHCFAAGNRIRLEICNADSVATEYVFTHEYSPRKVGIDTLYHDGHRPSRLILPCRPMA